MGEIERHRATGWVGVLLRRLIQPVPALRTGLLPRLVVAFALVLLLVVIANRAVTHGGLIVITERAPPPPAPRAIPAAQPPVVVFPD